MTRFLFGPKLPPYLMLPMSLALTAPLILTLSLFGSQEVDAETVCLDSDGRLQPIVFDSASERVVYPSGVCGPEYRGERFEGAKLYVTCTGSGNRVTSKGMCLKSNAAVTERSAACDQEGCECYRRGFAIPSTDDSATFFHEVFSVCWDRARQSPRWVRNKINPAVASRMSDQDNLVDYAVRSKFRYSPAIFGYLYNPRRFFSVSSQREKQLLESNRCGDFYSRGHLAPSGDYFLASERLATFFLENTVPQLQTHNNGEWKKIEDEARRTEGAHMAETGPLFFENRTRLYLDPAGEKLPIPDALYKRVYSVSGQLLMHLESRMVSECK